MNEIWANRLIAETKTWAEMPSYRRAAVKTILAARVANNTITVEQYETITGEEYAGQAV